MHAYGRVLQRMSDVDFRAASLDGVGIDWQQAIKGMVLLAAVAFDIYNQSTK